jgi:hypothetical protein
MATRSFRQNAAFHLTAPVKLGKSLRKLTDIGPRTVQRPKRAEVASRRDKRAIVPAGGASTSARPPHLDKRGAFAATFHQFAGPSR